MAGKTGEFGGGLVALLSCLGQILNHTTIWLILISCCIPFGSKILFCCSCVALVKNRVSTIALNVDVIFCQLNSGSVKSAESDYAKELELRRENVIDIKIANGDFRQIYWVEYFGIFFDRV